MSKPRCKATTRSGDRCRKSPLKGSDFCSVHSAVDRRKEAMLQALEQSHGVVAPAAKATGIHRSTHYNWMDQDKKYALAYEHINEAAIDHVESKLFEHIDNGNWTLIMFYLKTKAKHRGYIERSQVDDVSDRPKRLVLITDQWDPDEEEPEDYVKRRIKSNGRK